MLTFMFQREASVLAFQVFALPPVGIVLHLALDCTCSLLRACSNIALATGRNVKQKKIKESENIQKTFSSQVKLSAANIMSWAL